MNTKRVTQLIEKLPTASEIVELNKEQAIDPDRDTPVFKVSVSIFDKPKEIKAMTKELVFLKLVSELRTVIKK